MIFGYPIIIHNDHRNLSYETTFKNSRVMNWRLAIEEYLPTLQWLPGEKNVVADLLSRQPTTEATDDDLLALIVDECFNIPRDLIMPTFGRRLTWSGQCATRTFNRI